MSQAVSVEKVYITRQTIHANERGGFVPPSALALKISSVLKIESDKLFEWEDSVWL
ncbi:transcriptional regulator [Echinicola marina]|uniref:helix-turn-helix transcriptional regulator n=1 Tax=Echinicola marina TaxID=2859768 RepID=UPI001CF71B99|nr:transcriptional regulator [Echinicola marina]UCS92723.1 transcriptional regulator [Echinicola marina]